MKLIKYILPMLACCGPIPKKDYKGPAGPPGPPGPSGYSSLVEIYEATEEQCGGGGIVIISALDVNNSMTIDDEDIKSTMGIICNGADATVVPLEPIEVITPCGDGNFNRQVLLKLPSLDVLTSICNGNYCTKPRIAALSQGNYTTKDGYNCHYSITKTLTSLTISWSGTTLHYGE
jgi:hypothetical protein